MLYIFYGSRWHTRFVTFGNSEQEAWDKLSEWITLTYWGYSQEQLAQFFHNTTLDTTEELVYQADWE